MSHFLRHFFSKYILENIFQLYISKSFTIQHIKTWHYVYYWYFQTKMCWFFLQVIYNLGIFRHLNTKSNAWIPDIDKNLYEFYQFFLCNFLRQNVLTPPDQNFPGGQNVLIPPISILLLLFALFSWYVFYFWHVFASKVTLTLTQAWIVAQSNQ